MEFITLQLQSQFTSGINDDNECYLELITFISNIINNNQMTPNEIYDQIITVLWKDIDISEDFPIHFHQAQLIDNFFVGKSGGYWLSAFNRPAENSVFEIEGEQFIANKCGIFTFNFKPINESIITNVHYDNSELDDDVLNTAFIEDSSFEILEEELINDSEVSNYDDESFSKSNE